MILRGWRILGTFPREAHNNLIQFTPSVSMLPAGAIVKSGVWRISGLLFQNGKSGRDDSLR